MFNYKGREYENIQALQKTTRLKQDVLKGAYDNNALSKVIINRKNGFVDYLDYKSNAPQLLRQDNLGYLEGFNKNLKKDIVFSNSWWIMNKGRGNNSVIYDIGQANRSLVKFKQMDLKLLVSRFTFTIGAVISAEYIIRHKTLYYVAERLSASDMFLLAVNDIKGDYWAFLGDARQDAKYYLCHGFDEDNLPVHKIQFTEGNRENIFVWIQDIQEENKPDDVELRNVIVRGQQYYIRHLEPLKLDNFDFYNCDLFEYENPENKNCLINYLENHYPKQKKYVKSFTFEGEEPTLYDFTEFLAKNDELTVFLFDINGEVLYKQEAEENTKYKAIQAIIHNNHIYSIKHNKGRHNNKIIKTLCKIDAKADNILLYTDLTEYNNALCDIISQGYEPMIINENLFKHDKMKYIYNEDGENIKKFYEIYGLKTDYTVNRFNAFKDIFELYKVNYNSYFPYEYKQSGFNYLNSDFKFGVKDKIMDCKGFKMLESKNVFCADINKCYASSLAKLPFIITCNIAFHKSGKYNNENIIEHYLYIIKASKSCIYTPDKQMIISGRYLNYIKPLCKYPFEILEWIETTKNENKFTSILEKAYNTTDKEYLKFVKNVFNIMIGKFQTVGKKETIIKRNFKIVSNEALEFEGQHTMPINDDYSISYEINKKEETIYLNNMPISYQIIEDSRIRLIELMQKLNVNNDDIIQVKTDCILLNNRKKYINKVKLDSTNFYGYKEEKKIILLSCSGMPQNQNLTFDIKPLVNSNYCLNEMAGGGKTYKIINEIIPKCNNDYMVVAFQHTTLQPYKDAQLNHNTIDYYRYSHQIPHQKNIIIDEIGLCRPQHIEFILELYYKYNKTLYMLGDTEQLPPPFSQVGNLNDKWLKYFCYTYNPTAWVNRRNKITAEEYEKMKNITKEDTKYINELLDTYTEKDITKAENIIAYRVETVDRLKEKYPDKVVQTLYSSQGQTLKKIYFAVEDLFFLSSIAFALYTLISRFKDN